MEQETHKSFFERFVHSQVFGSIVLIIAAVTAVVWANSPWSELYHAISHLEIGVIFAGNTYQMGLAHWVKDGLMTIFFFVVGLEIKREVLLGELSSVRKATLPVLAAVGGSVTPALIYYFFNPSGPAMSGWGIPMATDIAFALGILALLGKRVPTGLKIFLTALAIVDDLIAVLVIAIFYTAHINIKSLMLAGFFLFLFYMAVKSKSKRPFLYLFPAIGVWACFMVSGIHATIAGVIIALLIPVKSRIDPSEFLQQIKQSIDALMKSGPLTRGSLTYNKQQWQLVEEIYLAADDMIPPGIFLEKHLHPVQALFILPLFALFAAGVTINAQTLASFPGPLSLGIIVGLILGKQVGITLFSWLAIVTGIADLPKGVRWLHVWGVSVLAGIGFTMSIFISELGLGSQALIDEAKISIFIASFVAGVMGYIVLRKTLPREGAAD
ncbi:MAG: Na+/H+ antiporter NhaA [Thermodesulfobacteria bacterium]|nr:Na+/H+ antiporter NhaA [Thermodesulfobacteriota bacterium]